MNIGQKIYELRTSKGMTLEELGNFVGVGKSTVRKWENGIIKNMRRDKIDLLANALGCSPAYLMGWIETPNEERLPVPEYDSDIQEWTILLPKLTADQKASLLQTARLFVQMNEAT